MTTDLDAGLACIKRFKQQLEDALDQRFGNNVVKPMTAPDNNALDTIDAPFTLCADAIVERINKETGATVYEVEKEGKVIYSTITRPLAFAFLAGVNANPAKGVPPKDAGNKPPTASVQRSIAAASDEDPSSATPSASKPEARKRAIL
jgi:hypothetical protein